MDWYLASATVLGVVAVAVLIAPIFASHPASTGTPAPEHYVLIHCRAYFEANGAPVSGVTVYSDHASAFTNDAGVCDLNVLASKYVRVLVYPPGKQQIVFTIPIADRNIVDVNIPI